MGLSDSQVKSVCKMGQGAAACSFLALGQEGFSCLKGSELEIEIKRRRSVGEVRAQGDNCSGPPDYKAK